MPLVKKQSGWFWGSKGPFDSKAKALSVARAAYASGYKEQSFTGNINEYSSKLLKDSFNSLLFVHDVDKLN
jgi:hypothetical protein